MNLKYRLKRLYYKYYRLFSPFYKADERMVMKALELATTPNMEGDYLEFGLWRGGSFIPAVLFAKYNSIKDMRIIGFDCFEGVPSKGEEEKYFKKGGFCCNYNEFTKIMNNHGLREKSDYFIVNGYYKDTLNEELRSELNLRKIRAVYMDCDLEESTKQALDFITPCLQDGTIIMFDDWFYCGGEKRAVSQWLKENKNIELERFWNFHTNGLSFIIRLKK